MNEGQNKIIDVTCALIIDNQNRLFAGQRSSIMSLPLKWELPGGKVELNETPQQCLIREIEEGAEYFYRNYRRPLNQIATLILL